MTGDGTADMMRIVCEATCEKGQPARAQSRMRNHAQKGSIRSRTKQAKPGIGITERNFRAVDLHTECHHDDSHKSGCTVLKDEAI